MPVDNAAPPPCGLLVACADTGGEPTDGSERVPGAGRTAERLE